jgi:hypothetical protein
MTDRTLNTVESVLKLAHNLFLTGLFAWIAITFINNYKQLKDDVKTLQNKVEQLEQNHDRQKNVRL